MIPSPLLYTACKTSLILHCTVCLWSFESKREMKWREEIFLKVRPHARPGVQCSERQKVLLEHTLRRISFHFWTNVESVGVTLCFFLLEDDNEKRNERGLSCLKSLGYFLHFSRYSNCLVLELYSLWWRRRLHDSCPCWFTPHIVPPVFLYRSTQRWCLFLFP